MRRYINCGLETGLEEIKDWQPNCWICIESPEEEDFNLISRLEIPTSFIDSISDPDERPRLERDGEWLMAVIRIPVLEKVDGVEKFSTTPMGIIARDDVTATICSHTTNLVPDFLDHTRRRGIKVDSVPNLILRLIYSSTFWFLHYLKDINESVNRTSRILRTSITNDDLLGLMGVQQALVYFNTSIKGNEVLIDRIRKVFDGEYDDDLLDQIEVEIKQAANTVDVYDDILAGMMDTYASVISNNVNDIMKKMTGVSVVIMFPTLIASFYGMNVAIQSAQSPWAFSFIVVGSIAFAIILYFVLRKIRWL